MRVLTAKEIRAVEQRAFDSGITEEALMERAGTACAEKIARTYEVEGQRIAVLCGNGKNAGDGFVIADYLADEGAYAAIVLADAAPTLPEPKHFFDAAVERNVKVFRRQDYDLNDCDIIVDCLFGIGFHGAPRAPFDEVFDAVNESKATVISIDTPSGTDATTGEVVKAVKADMTVAISTYKFAHVLPPANEYCGRLVCVNIGIPKECYTGAYAQTLTKTAVQSCFVKRGKNTHKGSFGHQLNLCGSYQMPGAAVIAAKAALRTGVGLLKCIFPKSIYPVMTAHMIQPLFCPVCENESKTVSIGALSDITDALPWADSIVLGCGIGNNDDTQVITGQVLKTAQAPIVLDADGINAVAGFIDIITDRAAPLIITPHPAEMGRLIGESADYVQQNRVTVAKAFAKEHRVIVVLKGANTVITDGKEVLINQTGNPGMAMGGTGDMLSGMIGSFLAQGMAPLDAAKCAVYIHGFCGDVAREELSQRGMTVEDMLSVLGAVMSDFE